MAEPTTNYIEIDGEGKYIEDTAAREGVAQNAADIEAIQNVIPSDTATNNKLVNASQLSETVISNVKRKEITNKTITLAQGGFASWSAVSGIETQPEMAFLRLSNFTHATESDCFVSLCSSKYGAHFLFRKVGSYEPIEGQVTISGVLSYIANR